MVRDKVINKLKGWKEKLLSQADKTFLIKAIAQAILTYIMSCFLLPNGFCSELESIINKF